MAPPPEYDKEPKAPDKSATNISCEEMKALNNLANDQQPISDNKSISTSASAEVENNKVVETLDDGQLRALLDEAITYKCPKDREGKSSLFKELLEEVEQDEQASEAAARTLGTPRGGGGASRAWCVSGGRGSRARRALPHSNSLQDLVAALAAEPVPRRHHRAPPAPAPAPVSARAIHGGSLPSGVDTSFLLGEEPTRGAGYLATVRCVNPPPLAERRVSATDANCLSEVDSLNRRSKAFPMTYTARATLEIGSGSVCSGRAVTTTTASNQVRKKPHPRTFAYPAVRAIANPTAGPPERLYLHKRLFNPNKTYKKQYHKIKQLEIVNTKVKEFDVLEEMGEDETEKTIYDTNLNLTEEKNDQPNISQEDSMMKFVLENDTKQMKLLSALFPKTKCDVDIDNNKINNTNLGGGSESILDNDDAISKDIFKKSGPRGLQQTTNKNTMRQQKAQTKKTDFVLNNKKREQFYKSVGKDCESVSTEVPTGKKSSVDTNNPCKKTSATTIAEEKVEPKLTPNSDIWTENINNWYGSLKNVPLNITCHQKISNVLNQSYQPNATSNICSQSISPGSNMFDFSKLYASSNPANVSFPIKSGSQMRQVRKEYRGQKNGKSFKMMASSSKYEERQERIVTSCNLKEDNVRWVLDDHMYPVTDYLSDSSADTYDYNYYDDLNRSRREYKKRVGGTLVAPRVTEVNPRNIRNMSIGRPLPDINGNSCECLTIIKENSSHVELKAVEDYNLPRKLFQDSVCSSSEDKVMNEKNNEEYCVEDLIGNLSVRSSTPIPENSSSENIEQSDNATVEPAPKEEIPAPKEVMSASDIFHEISNNSEDYDKALAEKKMESSPDANLGIVTKTEEALGIFEQEQGTVFPVVAQPDSVKIDNDEHSSTLCSFSRDKGQLCEVELVDLSPRQDEERCIEPLDFNSNSKVDASFTNDKDVELPDMYANTLLHGDIELSSMSSNNLKNTSFSKYLADQQKFFETLKANYIVDSELEHSLVSSIDSREKVHNSGKDKYSECKSEVLKEESGQESHENVANLSTKSQESSELLTAGPSNDLSAKIVESWTSDQFTLVLSKRTDNRKVFYALPNNLVSKLPSNVRIMKSTAPEIVEITASNDEEKERQDHSKPVNADKSKSKKKKGLVLQNARKEAANKRALAAVMFKNPLTCDNADKLVVSLPSATTIKEVDSAIPFSCITTPEVVASCNTTSSTAQSALAVDPKPLQLEWSYRGVASLTGAPQPPAGPACSPDRDRDQPRSVISTNFNGLPLTRPNYGSTGSTTQDEYKKSLDENGNSVQGFSSPLSGSSQHKKPRRKKSSKNETVIKSHQIDGYQGNKDLNEVLRFIESAADTSRAGKLGRAKHRDDADDKGGKKRASTRKDKESKMKRATSMEELSRTTLEDLTDKPSPPARALAHFDQTKAERRSWGDDARSPATRFFREETADAPPAPDSDFQTVTKKRKPRRRADEAPEQTEQTEPAGGEPGGVATGRGARAVEPRARRVSAPPSDRSNDSNDDMDSVHSLPADAVVVRATQPAPVSYADIARTRHNIPDLIESCNFYSEGDIQPGVERSMCAEPASMASQPTVAGGAGVTAPAPGDADGYPALEPRVHRRVTPPVAAHTPHTVVPQQQIPANKPPPPPPHRRDRKAERTDSVRSNGGTVVGVTSVAGVTSVTSVEEWPAPDVVADRRPAVILLDSAARPRDMDGVTFGFDINEQLLEGPTPRPRCDLVRDAIEGASAPVSNGVPPVATPAGDSDPVPGVPVLAGCLALRYVPPAPPCHTAHLHQIVDYVGSAWEDVVRCGAGKVRYYSE